MQTVLRHGLIGVAMLSAGIAVGRYAIPYRDDVARRDQAAATAGRPAPRRWEATVHVPLADNRGEPFSEVVWQAALDVLAGPFGGATLSTPQEGYWLDAGGRVCREPVRPVVITFLPERLDEFRRAVRAAGLRLGQEAMYVRFEEPRVELIHVHGRAHGSPGHPRRRVRRQRRDSVSAGAR